LTACWPAWGLPILALNLQGQVGDAGAAKWLAATHFRPQRRLEWRG